MLSTPVLASDKFFAETGTHSPGVIQLTITGGLAPYKVYKSLDNSSFEFMQTVSSNKYIEHGLNVSTTYYYKVVDSSGQEYFCKYTSPTTIINVLPLKVEQLGDRYVHLSWSHLIAEVDLYINGEIIAENITVNEYTVTDLKPNTTYLFYYVARSEERSNTVRITTTSNTSSLIGELNQMIKDLFIDIDFSIDSDNDGIVDALEDLFSKFDDLINNSIVKFPSDLSGSLGNSSNNTNGDFSDLPKFEVVIIPGYPSINLLPFEVFINEIKIIRRLLVAVLFSSVIFYFIKLAIPSLDA